MLLNESPYDPVYFLQENCRIEEVIEFVIIPLPEILIGVRIGYALFRLHDVGLLGEYENFEGLIVFKQVPHAGLVLQDGPDDGLSIFYVHHIVLVHHTDLGVNVFDFGPSLLIVFPVNGLKLRVPQYIVDLLLFHCDRSQ